MKHLLLVLATTVALIASASAQSSGAIRIEQEHGPKHRVLPSPHAVLSFDANGQKIIAKKGVPFTTTVANVDMKVTKDVVILTVPAGLKFYPTSARLEYTTVTAITTSPTVTFGYTGGTAAMVASVTPVLNSGTLHIFPIVVSQAPIPAGNSATMSITSGAVGTTLTATVHLTGYFL